MAGELWILRVRITEEKHTLSERTLSGLHMWLKVPGMRDEPTADDPDERRIWNWEHFAEADSAYNTSSRLCEVRDCGRRTSFDGQRRWWQEAAQIVCGVKRQCVRRLSRCATAHGARIQRVVGHGCVRLEIAEDKIRSRDAGGKKKPGYAVHVIGFSKWTIKF
ncbi:hypothetical protein B0H12DRAFT_1079834 [Mycena haematopus]|nr:hypothetical protein B0H12DRAFT_1079834 [Mycena haematopus]